MSVFGVILVCIFPHSDRIRRGMEYLSIFSSNEQKCGPYLRIQSECGKMRSRLTPNTDPFHAVKLIMDHAWHHLRSWAIIINDFVLEDGRIKDVFVVSTRFLVGIKNKINVIRNNELFSLKFTYGKTNNMHNC